MEPNQNPHNDAEAPGVQTSDSKRARSVVKTVLSVLWVVVSVLVVLLLLVLVLLQTNWAAQRVGQFAVGVIDPFNDAELQVDRVGGTFITRLELDGVRLVKTNDGPQREETLASIDTLRVRYSLLGLLRGRVSISELEVTNPSVSMEQQPDGSWDLMNIFPESDEPDTTSAFTLELDRVTLNNGSVEARFYAPDRDSTLVLSDLNLRAGNVEIGDVMQLAIDSLWLSLLPPGSDRRVDARAAGSLIDGRLALNEFRVSSESSDLVAGGVLRFPTDEVEEFHDIDFTLTADPIAFRDIHVFLPTLDPERILRADAHVGGTSRLITARLDADVDDGASVFLEAEATPDIEGPVSYNLSGEVRGFDPTIIIGGEAGSMNLNADLSADLEGASLELLNGTLAATVFDTWFGEYVPEQTSLDVRFQEGEASLDLRSGIRGTTFAANGTARPFDDVITYNLQGRINNLDFYRFTQGPGQSHISGTLRLEGQGVDQDADLTLDLSLDPSTINATQINSARLDARLLDRELNAGLNASLADGSVAARAVVQLTDPLRYAVTQGRVETLDVAALTGSPDASSLTGSFTGSGSGSALDEMVFNADIRLEPSHFGDIIIHHAAGSGQLNQGLARLDLEADLDGGSFDARATARPFATTPTFGITHGSFRNVDVGTLTGAPDQQTDLSGSIQLAGRGFDPATMTLDASLQLASSRINQQQIHGADVGLTMRSGDVGLIGDVALQDGELHLAGSIQPFEAVPTYAVTRGNFSGIDVGALMNDPGWATRLAGNLSVEGHGFEPETMTLDARLELDESVVNRERIDHALFEADIRNGVTALAAEADFSGGFLQAGARGRLFDDHPTYEATGAFDNLDIARIIHADTLESQLSGSFDVEGAGFDAATLNATGRVLVSESYYDRIDIASVNADFVMFDGLMQVESMTLRSNVLDLDGGGQIALFDTTRSSDFGFRLDVHDLAPVRPLMDVQALAVDDAVVVGRVYGAPGRIQFDGTADVTSLIFNDLRMADFNGQVAGELDPDFQLRAADVNGEVDFLAAGGFSLQRADFEASVRGEEVAFVADAIVDGRRDIRIAGNVDLRPDVQSATIDQFNLRLDRDRWELLQEATVTFGDEIRVSNLLLFADDQQIAIDGVIDPDGEQNLVMTVESFRVDGLTDLFGFEGLGGSVSGYVDLVGAADDPRLMGLLEMDLTSDRRRVGRLDLDLSYEGLALNLDALLTHEDGSTLTAEGSIPMDLRLADTIDDEGPGIAIRSQEEAMEEEVDLTIVSDDFSIDWLMPFMDPETVDRLDGRLMGTIQVGGTFSSPVLNGETTLREGRMRLPAIDITLRNIEADLTMVQNRIEISRFNAQSGSGRAEATGSLNLTSLADLEYDIRAHADGFLAADSDEFRIVADGDFHLSGSLRTPELTGNVTVVAGDIWLTEGTTAELVELSTQDLQTLEQRFGIRPGEVDTTAFDFFEAMSMDLSVRMERNTWLRSRQNPNMDIQFTGRLDVSKRPMTDMFIFGDIEVIPERSRIRQFGRVFDITTGVLQFNGAIEDMLLDLEAEYQVRSRNSREEQVVIVLGVTGRLDSLDLNLESRNPPGLDMADIVSYIATGRPASEGFQLGGSGGGAAETIGELGTTAFLNQMTGWVEGVAGDELGLDVIEIEQDGLRGTRITAGKYVTRRLYMAVSEPISFGTDDATLDYGEDFARRITLEFEVTDWLLTRLVRDGSNLQFNFLWEYSY